jgi:hypothetical protein
MPPLQKARPPEVKPNPLHPVSGPEDVLKGETVTMIFPGPGNVNLNLDDGKGVVTFHPGVQEVPVALADHWYLWDKGVEKYTPPSPSSPLLTEHHVLFLRHRGYVIDNVAQAEKFFEGLDNGELRTAFLMDAGRWKPEEKEPEEPTVSDVDLTSMTKAQLAVHADEAHGVELDLNKMTRDQMVAEIQRLRAEDNALNSGGRD